MSAERNGLVEGEDYYREGAALVFTERYHLRRGTCCGSGCRHCPFGDAARAEARTASPRCAAPRDTDGPRADAQGL